MATILVVEDEVTLLRMVGRVLDRAGHRALLAETGREALDLLRHSEPDLLVGEVRLKDMNGLDLIERAQALRPGLPSIVVTAYPDYAAARRGLRLGVFDWLDKRLDRPLDNGALVGSVEAALTGCRPKPDAPAEPVQPPPEDFDGMIGTCPAMVEVYQRIARVAARDTTVLLLGESGTGKELAARSIHSRSARVSGPFVAVNIAAVPDTLFEDRLFGHEAGAFTDARTPGIGLLDEANTGTLFLDEIGELSPAAQAKLLRVLEDRQFARLGGHRMIPVDVRVVAATNRDLEAAMAAGVFRPDLYHRLRGAAIRLPPLRERAGDLPRLIDCWLARTALDFGGRADVTPAARQLLEAYPYPGNVRELQNLLRDALWSAAGSTVNVGHLPDEVRFGRSSLRLPHAVLPDGVSLQEAWNEFERRAIQQALEESDGQRDAAARRLGIDVKTLRRKLSAIR